MTPCFNLGGYLKVDIMSCLGAYLKARREALNREHVGYSIRCVAKRVGMHHSYLSKVERGERDSLDERRIRALARELGEDPELLLALGGKLSPDLSCCLSRNPYLFREFLDKLATADGVEAQAKHRSVSQDQRVSELDELTRRLRSEIFHSKALERELKRALQNYKTLVNFLPDAVVLCELSSGRILDVNIAAENLWKRRREELLGLHQSALHPSDGNEQRSQKFKNHGTESLPGEVRAVILDGDGNIVPVVVTASRVMIDENPCVLGLFKRA
jgi:PAS domain S-box-containing protein